MKKRQIQIEKLKSGELGSLMEKLQPNPTQAQPLYYIQLNKETGIYHTAAQEDWVITYRCARRLGYCIQMCKEAGLLHTDKQKGRFS